LDDRKLIKQYFWEEKQLARKVISDYNTDNFEKQMKIIKAIAFSDKSLIIQIVGARGMGKTCIVFWLAEKIKQIREDAYFYIILENVSIELPLDMKMVRTIFDVPNNSFVIVDESAIRFNAREHGKEANIMLTKLLSISRQKNLTMFFITQHTHLIDVNIHRFRDIIFWKPTNDYVLMERGEKTSLKVFEALNKLRSYLAPYNKQECLFEYPAEKTMCLFSHPPASFWNEKLSNLFSSFDLRKPKEEDEKEIKDENEDIYEK
jgi:hypothetical protein